MQLLCRCHRSASLEFDLALLLLHALSNLPAHEVIRHLKLARVCTLTLDLTQGDFKKHQEAASAAESRIGDLKKQLQDAEAEAQKVNFETSPFQ